MMKKIIGLIVLNAALFTNGGEKKTELTCTANDGAFLVPESSKTQYVKVVNGRFGWWTSTLAVITWDIRVPKDDKYYLYFPYECREKWGGKIQFLVDNKSAFNLVINPEKKVLRRELRKLGSLDLTAGKHTLTIKTLEVNPHQDVMSMYTGFLSPMDGITKLPDGYDNTNLKETFLSTITGFQNAAYNVSTTAVYKFLWKKFPYLMTWINQDSCDREKARLDKKYNYMKDFFGIFTDQDAFQKKIITTVLADLGDKGKFSLTNSLFCRRRGLQQPICGGFSSISLPP